MTENGIAASPTKFGQNPLGKDSCPGWAPLICLWHGKYSIQGRPFSPTGLSEDHHSRFRSAGNGERNACHHTAYSGSGFCRRHAKIDLPGASHFRRTDNSYYIAAISRVNQRPGGVPLGEEKTFYPLGHDSGADILDGHRIGGRLRGHLYHVVSGTGEFKYRPRTLPGFYSGPGATK